MSLFNRISRVAHSNLNSSSSEKDASKKEPKILLTEIEQSISSLTSCHEQLECNHELYIIQAEDCYQQARLAAQDGDDSFAKKLLIQRKELRKIANNLKAQLEEHQQMIDRLKTTLAEIKSLTTDYWFDRELKFSPRLGSNSLPDLESIEMKHSNSLDSELESLQAMLKEL